MKLITNVDRAIVTSGLNAALALAMSSFMVSPPVYANDVDHPLHGEMPQTNSASELVNYSKQPVTTPFIAHPSIEAATSILAEQAMQVGEPDIGAAIPSAKASFGTLSAAQKANAQRAASALAQRAPSTSQSPHAPHTIVQPSEIAAQTTDTVTEVRPYIFVNSSTATPVSGDGLTINIALPQEFLKPDALGNPQNITINLSFPHSQ